MSRRMTKGSTWRACIRGICRSTAPSRSRCGAWSAHDIPYTLTPGVPAFAAAAAVLGKELTVPEVAQSLVLTRISGRASAMPPRETLTAFARPRAQPLRFISPSMLLTGWWRTPALLRRAVPGGVVARATWPDERIVRGTLGGIEAQLRGDPIARMALILVGPALAARDFRDSALYDTDYVRRFRSGLDAD